MAYANVYFLSLACTRARAKQQAITDGKHLLPGEVVVSLNAIFERSKGIGYDGLCWVELFREEYWHWGPYELAKKPIRRRPGSYPPISHWSNCQES